MILIIMCRVVWSEVCKLNADIVAGVVVVVVACKELTVLLLNLLLKILLMNKINWSLFMRSIDEINK